jgi:excisionase family DNA binding protein
MTSEWTNTKSWNAKREPESRASANQDNDWNHGLAILAMERLLLNVQEAAILLNLGRTTMYELVMRGEIVSVTIGRRRLIPRDALQRYIVGLEAVQSSLHNMSPIAAAASSRSGSST